MTTAVDLSIVIVSWNTRQLLEKCLASIYINPPRASFEVLVVDNASQDGTAEMVQVLFPHVRMITSRRNLGFARGNNRGLQASLGRFVLLLNPDTEALPGALDQLLDFLRDCPAAGGVGARLLNPDGSLQHSCSPAPTLAREFARMFHLPGARGDGTYHMGSWDLHTPRQAEVLLGACLLLRREALDRVGLLDEDYFIYSEEVDLCTRIRRAGWELYWEPRAQVIHHGGQSTRQAAAEMLVRLYEGKVIYFRKHHGPLAVQAYKFLIGAAALGRVALTPLAYFENPVRRRQHLRLSNHYRRVLAALGEM